MQMVINISKDRYEQVMKTNTLFDEYSTGSILSKIIANGTPIPDNATVGEVFCMLACKEPICETASYFTIDKELWNSPYQKGGKE